MNAVVSRFSSSARPARALLPGGALRWLVALWLCLFVAWVYAAPPANATTGGQQKNFNHLRTGFALSGVHAKERCESCHISGVFKGTPRDCVSCHSSGSRFARSNTVKPTKHLPTTQSCDACHGTLSFSTGRFNHVGVKAGTCASCHNGNTAPGKSADHLPTMASCDSCHRTVAWVPASGVDHSTFGAATNCASCHNGSTATGKTAIHIPTTSAGCFSCHSTTGWKPTKWNHTQVSVTAQCANCHTGKFPPAGGKSATHIPYASVSGMASANCDSCHKAGYASWTPAKLHSSYSVLAQCATCHIAIKPTTPVHTGATVCETCHKSTASWTGGSTKVDHSTFGAATNCASCHNGSTATGKTVSHIPTGSAGCFSCHGTNGWKPTKWNHTQTVVTAQCASCHSGAFPPANGKSATHIPYASVSGMASANCDSCHKAGYASWTPAKLHSSYSVLAQCATCHSGSFPPAVGKPATPIHTGATVCESCHKSTASWNSGSIKVDHGSFTVATNCASCHNNTTAIGKTQTHIPTGSAGCLSCHNTTAWKPTKWNHTQTVVTAQCASCHSGAFPPADGKPATHIPYLGVAGVASANCDSCHKAGYASWTPAKLHSSYSVSAQCASCHNGSFSPAVGKPNTAIHVGATVCESCHKSTASWTGGSTKVNHSTFTVATNCASCHNGSTATGKTAIHIPTGSAGCLSCHTTTAWKPTRWNHTQVVVTAQCSSCHSGSYPPADGKPATHIPYLGVAGVGSANCDSCHKAGYATWTPARFHSRFSVSAQCVSCHSGNYAPAVGKPNTPTHVGVTLCESCHKSTASWTSVSFKHSAANAVGTGTCDNCHNGSAAKGKPNGHIPVQTGASKCDSCHRSQTSFASAITMNHTVVTTTACKSCHNGSYTSQGATGALAKPSNHIPEAQLLNGAVLDCNACHSGTSSWTTVRMNHNASMGGGAGWCKGCHATGTSYLGSMEKKALTHQKKTPAAIDCSESGCHRPLGNKGAAYTKWD